MEPWMSALLPWASGVVLGVVIGCALRAFLRRRTPVRQERDEYGRVPGRSSDVFAAARAEVSREFFPNSVLDAAGWPEAASCGHRMPCGLVPDSPCAFAELSASMVLDPATIDPVFTGSSHTSLCPFGEDRGPGRGCLKDAGHEGSHMLFALPRTGDDLDD